MRRSSGGKPAKDQILNKRRHRYVSQRRPEFVDVRCGSIFVVKMELEYCL